MALKPSYNTIEEVICVSAIQVHEATIEAGAYPSPLNYYNFPKSVCTSVNEVGVGSTQLERPQHRSPKGPCHAEFTGHWPP